MMWVVLLAPLGAVLLLGFRVSEMSAAAVRATFWSYSALMGLLLAGIFRACTGVSIARAFLISAAAFAAMSLYGDATWRDLSQFGSFLFMGLISEPRQHLCWLQRVAVCHLGHRRPGLHRLNRLGHPAHQGSPPCKRPARRPHKEGADERVGALSRFHQPVRDAAENDRSTSRVTGS